MAVEVRCSGVYLRRFDGESLISSPKEACVGGCRDSGNIVGEHI